MAKRILVAGGGRGLGRGVAMQLAKVGHQVTLTAAPKPREQPSSPS